MAVDQGSPGPAPQGNQQEAIRVTPGGMVSAIPPHTIGLRGATATAPFGNQANGLFDLVCLNGQVAVPFLNAEPSPSDPISLSGSLLLGGQTVGAGDTVDVATQLLLYDQILRIQQDLTVGSVPMFNGEGIRASTTGLVYGGYQEPFTASGTGVTVTAGSNIFVGIGGTTWLADTLSGAYLAAGRKSLDLILPGDIIGVNDAGGTNKNWFRILSVTDNTHVVVFPTPTAGNASIGVNRAYTIIRTGYGSYSRALSFVINGTVYWYYAGTSHNSVAAAGQIGHGVVQALSMSASPNHYMGPKTVDGAGAATAFFPKADDIAFYKGYLLYGADTAVSWSVAPFPTGAPFSNGDFPAANISIPDATSRFVSFEYLGDQLIAIYEDSMWLVSATGTVPEFAFYRLPETLSVTNPAALEPCGIGAGTANSLVFGRASTTGRGNFFYTSNRGIERMSAGIAEEISVPISNVLGIGTTNGMGATPTLLCLSWSNDYDLLWVRAPGTVAGGKALVYNVATKDWSQFQVVPPQGVSVVAITGSCPQLSRSTDGERQWHVSYYETLANAGVPGTNGGNARSVSSSPDRQAVANPSTSFWRWRTPVIPIGLHYPQFSLGGFMLDAETTGNAGDSITWTLYGAGSPYRMTQRDSGTITPNVPTATVNTWSSSRARLGKKIDDPFIMLEFSGSYWIRIAGVVLFNANTQAMR